MTQKNLTQCPEYILEAILENDHEAIIFVDARGYIRWLNSGYAEFLNIKSEDAIGKYINDIIPQSRLVETMKSGKPQYGEPWDINGQTVVVHRWPIYNEGGLVGCIGKSLFKDEMGLVKNFIKRITSLESQLEYYREALDRERQAKYSLEDIVGQSEKIIKLKAKINRIAKTTSTVLITGESGTGKELIAHALHSASPRHNKAFVRVNCTTIPEELLESELFGYEEGAFTGAKRGGKLGKFEIAQGGTIFLDEIGDMNRSMQAKLLRVLQEREIERIGATKPVSVDVRVIAATNRNLEEMMQADMFREDLYYRLNVVLLHSPPLRERREDTVLLTEHLVKKITAKFKSPVKGVTAETLDIFQKYSWPGNIRELENLLEQAINLTDSQYLVPEDFPQLQRGSAHQNRNQKIIPLEQALEQEEKRLILKALAKTDNNRKRAAELLNIHRSVLYRKLLKHDIK